MNAETTERLEAEDDPELWRVVIDTILADLQVASGMTVEFGRCSHWFRPHQTRWTADGGFALPVGYGGTWHGLPQFDWSVVLEWTTEGWVSALVKSDKPSLRIAIPSRTARHLQAAVHTQWKTERKERRIFYGFRKKAGGRRLTAVSDRRDAGADRRAEKQQIKSRTLGRRLTKGTR